MNLDLNSIQSVATTNLTATAVEGSKRALGKMNEAAQKLSAGEITPSNMVALKEQAAVYSINMQLIKAADETTGQLLNLRA